MVKFSFKSFVSGILIGCLVMIGSVGFAASGKSIKALLNAVSVKIDGKVLSGDKISYNNDVFVSSKALATYLGKERKLDKSGNVSLENKSVSKPKINNTTLFPTIKSQEFIDKFYRVTFSDGFTCSISSDSIDLNDNYIAITLLVTDASNNIEIKGFNKEKTSSYIPINLSEYINIASTETQKNNLSSLDFFEKTKQYKNGNLNGIIVFKCNPSNLNVITFTDGKHTCDLMLNIPNVEQSNIPPLTDNFQIGSKEQLQQYLQSNFSNLQTSIGNTNFTFDIIENTNQYFAYDYWIQMHYDSTFFTELQTSIKYTKEQKEKVKQELKDFQEKLGRTIVSKLPNKKLYGGYYISWYKYPTLKLDLQSLRYFSWENYNEPSLEILDRYNESSISTFRWYDIIDDKW